MQARFSTLLLTLFIIVSCSSPAPPASPGGKAMELIEEEMPPRKSYDELKKETSTKKELLRKRYNAASTQAKKDSVIVDARRYLLAAADEYFRAWYNTPWTFEGHSQVPGEGSIACGYFVTTTLRDMGFRIPRIKWAQQASEYVVNKTSHDIKRFYNKPMADIVADTELRGEGLYIVGLDSHVGYIYYTGSTMSFVHANYYKRKIGVMSEQMIGRNPLNDSKYRIIGKIFGDEMIRNWLLDVAYKE